MNEQITIDKAYYDFLLEKAKERCELYSENRYLQHKLRLKEISSTPNLTREEWNIYHDFISNHWYPLAQDDMEREMALAKIMMNRSKSGELALEHFTKERNID